ncbi:MAG: hypothetical protein JXA95_17455 [Spirochaetales bacterium]|nr:hypothetical protein [Spirochaetales bacterium]
MTAMKKTTYLLGLLLILTMTCPLAAKGENEQITVTAAEQAPGGTPPGEPPEGMPGDMGGPGMPGGGSTAVEHGTAANTLSDDIVGSTYVSSGDEENALRVEGGEAVILQNVTIQKNDGEAAEGDRSNFYGSNAAFLAFDRAQVTIKNSTVQSSAEGGNGIFSYGEGTVVTVSNTVVNTTGNSSGGVMVTGGGTMYVFDSEIETQGRSSASLRTDRGGGILIVDGGTYTANGEGSPAIYSTADVSVSNAVLTATSSEAVVVEGKNSVALENCDLTGNMQKDNVENLQNVMIYQSMSGDADSGKSSFTMTGGSLTSQSGDMIYVTDTACSVELSRVELSLSNDVLLRVAGNDARNGWGVAGENGGDCEFTAEDQILTGKIIVDEISTLSMNLSSGTSFTGSINEEQEGGQVSLTLDSSSTWTLTGDSHITSLTGDSSRVITNGFTLYVNGEEL